MNRWLRMAGSIGLAAAPSCGSTIASGACTEGQQIACACPGGESSVQICQTDGTYGPCACGTGGAGGGGAGGSSGGGGGGGGGAGGAPGCVPDVACYDGPAGTENVGICASGLQFCKPDGSFGPCVGQTLPAVEDCLTPEDDDCDGATAPCPVPWENTWGEDQGVFNTMEAFHVATDALGAIYVAGRFTGSFNLGSNTLTNIGTFNSLLVKLSGNGTVEWVQQLASTQTVAVLGLSVDPVSHRIAVSGSFSSDMVFAGKGMVGEGDADAFLYSLDLDGNFVWAKQFATAAHESAMGVDHGLNGEVVVTGLSDVGVDLGGGMVPSGVYLAKFDSAGNHLWSNGYPGNFDLQDVTVVPIGWIVLGGTSVGPATFGNVAVGSPTADGYLVAFDGSGVPHWGRTLGGSGDQFVTAVADDGVGGVFVTGHYVGASDFGSGPVAVPPPMTEYTFTGRYVVADGTHLWDRAFTGAFSFPRGIAASGSKVYVVGGTNGALDFGGGSVGAVGASDAFVARLDFFSGDDAGSAIYGTNGDEQAQGVVYVKPVGPFVTGMWTSPAFDLGAGTFASPASDGTKTFVSWTAP